MNNGFNNTEEIGLNAVRTILTERFGWIARDKLKRDMGIDIEAETMEEGLLIQIQVKTGLGNFKAVKEGDSGLTYYVKQRHFDYWTNLKAPVLFAAHIPETGKTHWQIVSRETLVKSKKTSWKLFVPFAHELNDGSREYILDLLTPIKMPIDYRTSTNSDGSISVTSGLIDLGRIRQLGSIDAYNRVFVQNPTIASILRVVYIKAEIHIALAQLRHQSYSNPFDYSIKLAMIIKYIELDDFTNAYAELDSLLYSLGRAEKNLSNRIVTKWAKFYLETIGQNHSAVASVIGRARPVIYVKIFVFGENTFLIKIAPRLYLGEDIYELHEYSYDTFMLPVEVPLNKLRSDGQMAIQLAVSMQGSPDGLQPSFSHFSVSPFLSIYHDGRILEEFSESIF